MRPFKYGMSVFFRLVFVFMFHLFLLSHFSLYSAWAESTFERLDTNGDGQLSRREFSGPRQRFRKIDSNGDDFVSPQELRAFHDASAPQEEDALEENTKSTARSSFSDNADEEYEIPLIYVDTHSHLAGWMQKKGTSRTGFRNSAREAIRSMDKLGIKTTVFMPTPQPVTRDNSEHDITDYIDILNAYPDRFVILAGGGTLNVMIQQALEDGLVSIEIKRKFRKIAEDLLRQGAHGFGEMTTEHFSMNPTHPYITAPSDHELFLLLADIAAEYDVPIDIHMEAIPRDMPLPKRMRNRPRNPEMLTENIESFERLLDHNPDAKIVWAHAGWCNTGERTPELCDRLLSKHPNLYMSLRIVPNNIPGRPIDANGRIKPAWRELILKYPDRFLIGGDEFHMPHKKGKAHPSAGSTRETVNFLAQLPPDIAEKIGHENAIELYHLKTQ